MLASRRHSLTACLRAALDSEGSDNTSASSTLAVALRCNPELPTSWAAAGLPADAHLMASAALMRHAQRLHVVLADPYGFGAAWVRHSHRGALQVIGASNNGARC